MTEDVEIIDLKEDYQYSRERAAIAVYQSGAFKVASDLMNGEFELQIHRAYPNAPLSPVYINLRPQGVKGGTLSRIDINNIGISLATLADINGLFDTVRTADGIPSAGIPFIEAMKKWLAKPETLHYIGLRKVGEGTEAKISPPEINWPQSAMLQNTLLLDDLVTKLGTKKQAIAAVESMGGRVTDILLFVDRSGGRAKAELEEMGIRLHVVWDFMDLLEFWYVKGYLGSRTKYEALLDAVEAYPKKLAPFTS